VTVKIKDIPIEDRPRERLINYGAESLSNEELLSIILKTGSKNKSAKDLASFVLHKINGLKNLNELNLEKLRKIDGIGDAKACTILAIIELNKRVNKKVDSINNIKFNNCEVVYEYYKDKLQKGDNYGTF